jgi:uncharacterized protein
MSRSDIRLLSQHDHAITEAFLKKYTATSMFLRSNARAAGMEDRGDMFHAHYLGAFTRGELIGVIAHCWNGMILPQAPEPEVLAELYAALLRLPTVKRRGIRGASGEYQQICAIADWLKPAPVQLQSCECLFGIGLANLRVPPLLHRGEVVCRRIEERDLPTLLAWRIDYAIETLQVTHEDIDSGEEEASLQNWLGRGHGFVLQEIESGELLSTAAFNAALPDVVQIGNVWTPPELRSRGYARAVVAGQLLIARGEGVREANLFANNRAAIKAYEAIGFRRIGDFGILLLKRPHFPH